MSICFMKEKIEELLCKNNHLNNPVIFIDKNNLLSINERLLCKECIDREGQKLENSDLISIDELIEKVTNLYTIKIGERQKKYQEKTQILEQFSRLILTYQQYTQQILNSMNQNVIEWKQQLLQLSFLPFEFSLLQEIQKNCYPFDSVSLTFDNDVVEQLNLQFSHKITQLLQEYQQQDSLNKFNDFLLKLQFKINCSNSFPIKQKVKTELHFPNKTIKATAFNFDDSLLFVAGHSTLEVIDIKELNQIQKIAENFREFGSILLTSKKQNLVIFNSQNQFQLYYQEYRAWKVYQTPQIHQTIINFIAFNENEDQVISSSFQEITAISRVDEKNRTIIFMYTLSQNPQIQSMSINIDKTKIIQCDIAYIKFWKYDSKWTLSQTIQNNKQIDAAEGIYLQNDDILLKRRDNQLLLMVFKQKDIQFYKTKEIEAISESQNIKLKFFPNFYNSCRQLFIQKVQNRLYILKNNQQQEYEVWKESIICSSDKCLVQLSQSGNLLAIWEKNENLKLIQLIYENQ